MRTLILGVLLVTACSNKVAPPAIDADGSTTYGGARLSAPIVTDPSAFAPFADATAYGKLSVSAKTALVTDHTHTFRDLLTTCAATDPTIVLSPATPAQRNANYAAVATCAYKLYGPTPAWVPQLVGDVDVCSTRLDGAWRTPTTSELIHLPPGYPTALEDAIVATGTTEPIYAGLTVYALTLNSTPETVDVGHESPSLSTIVAKTTLDTDPIGVRCIFYE